MRDRGTRGVRDGMRDRLSEVNSPLGSLSNPDWTPAAESD